MTRKSIYKNDDLNHARFVGAIKAYAAIHGFSDAELIAHIREEVMLFEAAEAQRKLRDPNAGLGAVADDANRCEEIGQEKR
jgi:hypothetical protein